MEFLRSKIQKIVLSGTGENVKKGGASKDFSNLASLVYEFPDTLLNFLIDELI